MKKILALVLALMLVLSCASIASAEDVMELNIWSFTTEFGEMIDKYFTPTHPNIKINYTVYPTDGNEYVTKVDTIMASAGDSAEAPDIFTLEAAFVKRYVQSEWTANLLDVGFTAEDFASSIPCMLQIGQNSAGVQKGLAWQSTPGALFYRADLAEKYLGVTTPEDFQAKVGDWFDFMDTAAELYEASEGAAKMVVCAGDIWNAYQYNRTQGWVVDGKLNIDPELYDFVELAKTLEEDDLSQKGSTWSETWYAGMRGETETLCFFLPTWGLHYTIKPNCTAGWDASLPEEENAAISAANNGTYGLWRIVAGPVGYSWGGTWVGANAQKVAVADEAKKAAIKEIIRYFTLDEGFLYQYALDSGDFVSNNTVVNKIVAEGGTPNPFLGGQDHYAIFAEAANLANGSIMTEYDDIINGKWDTFVTTPYSKGEKGLDECIADFKAEVKAAYPELIVE